MRCSAVCAALTTVLASSCQQTETRELGFTQSAQNLTTDPTQPFNSPVDGFLGRWVGQADDALAFGEDGSGHATYHFPSGSARFVLEVASITDEFGKTTWARATRLPAITSSCPTA